MAGGQGDRLGQLTALRFLAALLVLLSHLVFLQRSQSPVLRALYDGFLQQGACGVTFFFILSGFILTHAYERALQSGEVSCGTYLYRRVTRVLPLHLMVGLAFLAFVSWRGDLPPVRTVLLNFTLLQSWFRDPLVHYSLNGPSWSLSDELFFYAAFPFLVRFGQRVLRGLFVAGLALILAGACIAALRVDGYSPFVDWLFYVFPITRLFEFIAGILLCRMWRSGVGRPWATSGTEVLLVAALLAIMMAVEGFGVPLVFRYQLVFLPPMAALILVFAYGRGVLSRLLRNPVLQWLGEASFALYLIHRPMITVMAKWSGGGAASDVALALALPMLSVPAALLTFALLDQPMQQWLRRPRRGPVRDRPLAMRKG